MAPFAKKITGYLLAVNNRQYYFWIAFALCGSIIMFIVWSNKYLPMVDIPQHSALIAIWKNINDPNLNLKETYQIKPFVPVIVTYGLTRIFHEFLPITSAMKITISLALLGLPLAMYSLLKRFSVDPWWSLLGFPFSFGFTFYWGLLGQLAAIPIAIYVLSVGYKYAKDSQIKTGIYLAILNIILFYTHAIIFGYTIIILTAIIISYWTGWKKILFRLLPLSSAIPFIALWLITNPEDHAFRGLQNLSIKWYRSLPLDRFFSIPASLISIQNDVQVALIVMLAGVIFLLVAGPKLNSNFRTWIPFLLMILYSFFAPYQVSGVWISLRAH